MQKNLTLSGAYDAWRLWVMHYYYYYVINVIWIPLNVMDSTQTYKATH